MNMAKSTISGAALVATFLFLPSDTWSFWMLKKKELLYGELVLVGETEDLAVAKNVLDIPILIEQQSVRGHWSLSLEGGPIVDLTTRPEILPKSYSLLRVSKRSNSSEVLRSLGGGRYFRPAALTLTVPAERDKWVVLVLFLMAATAGLTWSVHRYIAESGLLGEDKE